MPDTDPTTERTEMPDFDWGSDEFDPFAAQADEDAAAMNSGPEGETFDWHVDQEYADPEPADPMAATAAEEEPDFVRVEEPAKEKTPAELVKEMSAEDFASLLQLRVLQKIVNNAIADFDGSRKDYLNEILPTASKKFATDSWKVRVPTLDGDDVLVGTVSVKRTKEKVEVTSQTDLVEWAEKNFPDAVVEETIPAKIIPAKTIKRFKLTALDDVVKKFDAKVTPEGDYVTADGEPIPGLHHIKKDQYDGHMISFGGTGNPQEMAGRDLLLRGQIKGQSVSDVITAAAIEKGTQ